MLEEKPAVIPAIKSHSEEDTLQTFVMAQKFSSNEKLSRSIDSNNKD